MPTSNIDPHQTLYYEDDYFGEPWKTPETVLLIHGAAESSKAWFGWVPHLSRKFRVVRPDQRGFGHSQLSSGPFTWSPEALAADMAHFLDALDVESAHVVGAKIGGTVAMQFAADFPARTKTLTVVSSPARTHNTGGSADLSTFTDTIRRIGGRGWAAETQRARLGSGASDAQLEWWTDFMAATNPEVAIAITEMAGKLDITSSLPRIKAPTLVITTESSALASVEVTREWQAMIPRSELLVLPGDSYHVAAAAPDLCAEKVLEFIQRSNG
jgi:pimeloyl-ACP methyl ester carboxylesterase